MPTVGSVYIGFVAMLLISNWQIGNGQPWAWLVNLGCRLGFIVFGAFTGAGALIPVSAAFILVDWRNYRKWRKERPIESV